MMCPMRIRKARIGIEYDAEKRKLLRVELLKRETTMTQWFREMADKLLREAGYDV